MRRNSLTACVVVGLVLVSAVSAANRDQPSRHPAGQPSGHSDPPDARGRLAGHSVRDTRFVISFRAPQRTGRVGAVERRYRLSAQGPAQPSCASSGAAAIPSSRQGARVSAQIGPAGSGADWCPGVYLGKVWVLQSPVCRVAEPCPDHVAWLGTIGRFTFRVERPRAAQ